MEGVRKRLRRFQLFEDTATAYRSLEACDGFSPTTHRSWKRYRCCYIGLGSFLLCFAFILLWYVCWAPVEPELKFLHQTKLLTSPVEGSTWEASRLLDSETELLPEKARLKSASNTFVNLSSVFTVHARLLDESMLRCVAPVLYGENIQLLTVRDTPTHLHLIHPRQISAYQAHTWAMANANFRDRFTLATDNYLAREAEVVYMAVERFPLFDPVYASASKFMLKQRRYIWINATVWPELESRIFEFNMDNGGGCVQSMLAWFNDGRPPLSRSAYIEKVGSNTQ
jgi:hypothetical protein